MITDEKTKTEITVEGLKGLGFKTSNLFDNSLWLRLYEGIGLRFNYKTNDLWLCLTADDIKINIFPSLEDIQTFINFFKKQNEKN